MNIPYLIFHQFIYSLGYVAQSDQFWASMGFVTAVAMFVGVILYDGNLEQTKKGLFAILSYALMLIWTNSVRIVPLFYRYTMKEMKDGQAFAGMSTIIYLTLFWILGLFIGVNIFRFRKKPCNKSKF